MKHPLKTTFTVAAMGTVAYAVWRLFFRHRMGPVEKAGHAVDATAKKAAENLEKAAAAIEETSDFGLGRRFGQNIDEALGETKAALHMASRVVHEAIQSLKR